MRCPSCNAPVSHLTAYSLVRMEIIDEEVELDEEDDDDSTTEEHVLSLSQQEDAGVYVSSAAVEAGLAQDPDADIEGNLSIYCESCQRHYALPRHYSIAWQ